MTPTDDNNVNPMDERIVSALSTTEDTQLTTVVEALNMCPKTESDVGKVHGRLCALKDSKVVTHRMGTGVDKNKNLYRLISGAKLPGIKT